MRTLVWNVLYVIIMILYLKNSNKNLFAFLLNLSFQESFVNFTVIYWAAQQGAGRLFLLIRCSRLVSSCQTKHSEYLYWHIYLEKQTENKKNHNLKFKRKKILKNFFYLSINNDFFFPLPFINFKTNWKMPCQVYKLLSLISTDKC